MSKGRNLTWFQRIINLILDKDTPVLSSSQIPLHPLPLEDDSAEQQASPS